uniref:Odorant receptor n=1 Tax=Conogethes pinicolalis TaxID=1178461 RepID=A0A5B9GB71_9NEOP|nr:odorant receptor 41 [Conogethes pinicolalis]
MIFGSKKNKQLDDIEEQAEFTFRPFHETYRWIATSLTLGLMYPNPATDRTRLILIVTSLLMMQPVIVFILIDMYMCWLKRDIFNIIRHSTIIGPFLGAFFKMLLMYYKRVQAKELIDEMNRDYSSYNRLPRHCRAAAAACVRASVTHTERLWAPLVGIAIMTFPGMAVVATLCSHVFAATPQRYMVHDLNRPFREPEARFDSPYFETLFLIMFGGAIICVFNYTSYDGLFGLMTRHACLKMSIYCMRLRDGFRSDEPEELYRQLMEFIREQRRMFRFGALIQDAFNIWLGTILISTMIQVGSLLFHISAGYGFDVRYMLFSVCSVVHILLPCKNAANLKMMSMETATLVYCCGWERTSCKRVRRMIPFLIARAQRPIRIMAFYMFQYDMELFVNIMRTSYSMFTLLRS